MRIRLFMQVMFLVVMAVHVGGAGVSAAEGKALTLDACIMTALENNPELRSGNNRVDSKISGLRFAKSQRQPIFKFSESASRTNSPVMAFMSILGQERFTMAHMNTINEPETTGNFNTKFSFQLPIYNGRQVRNGIRMASLDLDATSLDLKRKKQEVRYKVVEAYMNVLLAKEHLKVANDAYKTAEAHVKTAGSHLAAGTVVKSDLLSAEVRFAQIEEMQLAARNHVELAKANLLYTMGVSQAGDINIEDESPELQAMDKQLPELIEMAKTNRAELGQLKDYAAVKRYMADMAKASKRPSLNLMAEYNLDNNSLIDSNGESWLAGVGVSMNVFDGGRARHSADKSVHEALEMESNSEALRQGIELQVRQAFLELKTEREKIDVTSRAVEQAQEALRIVENRYGSGLTTIVEVLDSETKMTEARMRHVTALHSYSKGLEKLWFAVGINGEIK